MFFYRLTKLKMSFSYLHQPSFLHTYITLLIIAIKIQLSQGFNGRELKPIYCIQKQGKKEKRFQKNLQNDDSSISFFFFLLTPLPMKYLVYIRREEKWKITVKFLDPWLMLVLLPFSLRSHRVLPFHPYTNMVGR